MSKHVNSLNKYLRDRRKELHLSQADLAKELGYSSPQFVSNWERGLVSPPLASLARLMELLKIPRQTVIDLILEDTRKELDAHLPAAATDKGSAQVG